MKKLIGTLLVGLLAVACAPQGNSTLPASCHCKQCHCSQCTCATHAGQCGQCHHKAHKQCHKPS